MHIPGTNVTLLNRKAGMSLQKTFWHETFHWIKANNDPLWEELLTYFKGKTAFTKEQIDSYREKYGRYDLQRDEDVIEELLADAFVDVKQRVPLIQEMAKENPSLAKKFVAWLKRMMDRFVEVFHNPEGKLTTAQRDQFVEAFGRLAASMVDGNKKKLFKTYNNGKRITFLDGEPLPELQFSRRSRLSAFDVDFDEIKDVRKKYEGTGQWMKAPNGEDTNLTESDNIKYSFAGENAENAPLEALERAKKMDGKSSPTEIYKKTGWFKGQDGKWRFEISDNLNKINFDRLEKSKAGSMYYTLGEIYDNPKLYEAYPDLIRVLVGKEEGMGTVNGQVRHDEGEPIIVLNADKLNQPSMKTTLIHEIQHVIQQKEGFAAGGSPESVRDQIRERAHDILKKLRKLDNANELIGRYQAMNKAFFDYIENPDVDKEMEMRRESDRLADEYELFAATLPKKLSDEVIGLWNQKQNLMDALENGSDFELYRNLGGEQEAREVARRSEGATRLSKQNSDTQEAEKALNDALENATENQMKAYRNREKLDKEIRKQGGRPTEEQLEKMESYDKAMGEALSEAYDNYLWERDTADEMKEEMGTPTPHNDDAIIVFNGKEFAMSNENNVDNSENVGDNESRITDKQKDELFRQVSSHLDSYIYGQVAKGKNRDELLKELASEHSSHRERLIGGYRATARDFEARKGDREHRQAVVEAHWPEAKTWNENREAKIAEAYNLFTDQIKEVVDYAGVLYREIVIDRARASRDSGSGIQLRSWRDAERQCNKRESGNQKNNITETTKHSSASAFSMPKNQDSTAGTKFSINASDNSTPSLAHRIKNILAGTPATAQAKEQYRRRMARMIEDALGIKIRTGKLDVGRPANGTVIYKPNDKVIRSLHAYDWENILPVASGLMAERLGIISRVIKPFTNRQHGISRKASMKNPKG